MSTALDPRFKLLKCIPKEKRDEVWARLQQLVSDLEAQLNPFTSTESSEGIVLQVFNQLLPNAF